MPFVWQHPGIGNVAIKARGEYQNHHAHFVTFAAKVLARKSMPEFMQDLCDTHGQRQPQPIFGSEEFVESGKLRMKRIPLDGHQYKCGKCQYQTDYDCATIKKPADVGVQPIQ